MLLERMHVRPPAALLTWSVIVLCTLGAPSVYGFIMFGSAFPEFLRGPALGNALLNTAANAVIAFWAIRMRGRLDQKLAEVLSRVVLAHGALAFAVLVFRLDYSNQVMLGAVVISALVGVTVVLIRDRATSARVAVIDVDGTISDLRADWTKVTSPQTDLRHYDHILTGSLTQLSPEWTEAISKSMIGGKRVRHLAEYIEETEGRTSIEHFDIDHLPVSGLTSYGARKRLMDIVFVLATLPLTLPILGFGMLVVLVTMGRPVMFSQQRAGLAGEMFVIYKLRTMRIAPPGASHAVTLNCDARITASGRWLRRTRIDELPQLWNVIKGDMSLIGPRPEWAPLSEAYGKELPTYKYRNLVRPGITGWAQTLGGYASNVAETKIKLGYDLYYVKNMSLGLDLQIMLRTVWTVLTGRGAR